MRTPSMLLAGSCVSLVVALVLFAPATCAATNAVPLAQAEADLRTLADQLKEAKTGNEDLLATIAALEGAFFRLDPATPAADVTAWQSGALDHLVRAVELVRYDAQARQNMRSAVNQRAAEALGNVLGSPDLATLRDEKELAKLRSERAVQLRGVLTTALGRPKGNRDYTVPAGVLEAAFVALGRTNDPATLDWLREEYTHTRAGEFEELRLVAAHKAMVLFTNVPARARHAVVKQLVTAYAGTAATATAEHPNVKAFWDRIKFGVVEAAKYYATAPGGGPPANGEGEVLNTLEELVRWWRDHDRLGKSPWVDPKPVK